MKVIFTSRLHVNLIKNPSNHRVKACLTYIIDCVNAGVVLKITSADVIIYKGFVKQTLKFFYQLDHLFTYKITFF